MVKCLVEGGAAIDAKSQEGVTPLYLAAKISWGAAEPDPYPIMVSFSKIAVFEKRPVT